jgi:hypothetical protein
MTAPLPVLRFENVAFWTGGAQGQLLIYRCQDCGQWLHPPQPICRGCLSRSVAPEPVAGAGEVYSYTINHQPWLPDQEVPYVVAVVRLDEDPRLRITTRLVDVDLDEVRIGMRVRVRFEQHEDVWLPLFAPERTAA